MKGLEGKVALVTGAGRKRGIGRAIALRLAEEGVDIVVSSAPRAPSTFPGDERSSGWLGVQSVVQEIRAMGRRAIGVGCDVSDAAQVDALVRAAIAEMGRIDILVNNAALASDAGSAPILDVEDSLWYRAVDVNLHGLYLVTKSVGRTMRAGGNGGSIVNISSTAGRVGVANVGAYCATKWAMVGLTQQLALELVAHNIRVNCICPGSTDTDMLDATRVRRASMSGSSIAEVRAAAINAIPMARQASPGEQAAAVAFLASDDASFITGQTLNVDGGVRMD